MLLGNMERIKENLTGKYGVMILQKSLCSQGPRAQLSGEAASDVARCYSLLLV